MRTTFTHLLTAAVLLASASCPLLAQQEDKTPLQNTSKDLGQKLQQLGSQQADPKTATDARAALAQLISNATTGGKFLTVISSLARPDRDRIGDMPRENFDELNKAISQFRVDFQAKYHQDFTFGPEYLNSAEVNVATAKNTLTVSLADLEKNPAADPSSTGAAGTPLPKATGLAVVSGPTVTLVNEGSAETPAWKVKIPAEIGGSQLKQTLTKHIQKLDDQKAAWPDDPRAAYHAVATEILQALTDTSIASER